MSIFKSICADLNIPISTTTKTSYGGGYSMPKTSNQVQTYSAASQVRAGSGPSKPNPVVSQAKAGGIPDLVTSIDRELSKMRSDSSHLAEFRIQYTSDFPKTQLSSLDEIEKMRLIHQEKVKVLETEYLRTKDEKLQQQQPKPSNFYYHNDPHVIVVERQEIEDVDERETLLKWLFTKLDVERAGLINKEQMIEEIQTNEQLLKYFKLDPDTVEDDINELLPGEFISQNDFLRFFVSIKPKVVKKPEAKVKFPDVQGPQDFPQIVLTSAQLNHLERVFKEVDVHNDMAVQKFEYLQSLRTDDDIIKLFQVDAVEISKSTYVTLEEVIDSLQETDDLYDYITYSQFLSEILSLYPKQIWLPEENKSKVLLDELYQQILLDIFDSMPRKSKNLIKTSAFLSSLQEDPQVQTFLNVEVHKGQTVSSILKTISRESGDLITWEDFLSYFSEKNRPDIKVQENGINKSNYYALKEDFVKEAKTGLIEENKKNFAYKYVDTFKNKKKKAKSTIKFTVPQPFAFDSRERNKGKSIRQMKLEQYVNEIQQEEENHLNYRPTPNPVPAEVIIPKYNTLIAAQEARRNEVKMNSKKLTQEREKPFEFYIREKNKPKPEEAKEEPYKFKAKAPPPSNSIPLYEQMSRKLEEDRKSRIEAAAKKALEEAKMPERMERYAKGDKNLSVPPATSNTFKAKKPPNFHDMWNEFGKSMENKKKSFQPTVPKEFNFTESNKSKKEEVDEDLAKKGFLEINKKKLTDIKEMEPTKKQSENDDTGKKRREELQKKEEEKRKMKEEREILEELQKKRLEEKKKKEREKIMLGVKDRPPIEDAITSEYSKANSGTRVLTSIKLKMQARGILNENIIGETDNFIDIIAEDLV